MTVLFMNSEHQPFPAQQLHNIKPTQIGMCFAGIIPEWRTIIVRWYLLGRESHFVLNVCLLVYFLYSSGCRMTICMWVALIRLREDFHFGGYFSLYTCMKFWTINKIYVKKFIWKIKQCKIILKFSAVFQNPNVENLLIMTILGRLRITLGYWYHSDNLPYIMSQSCEASL